MRKFPSLARKLKGVVRSENKTWKDYLMLKI